MGPALLPSCLVVRDNQVCSGADVEKRELVLPPDIARIGCRTINDGIRVAPPGISLLPLVLRCPLAHEMSKCE
jgi:hypothetical protein